MGMCYYGFSVKASAQEKENIQMVLALRIDLHCIGTTLFILYNRNLFTIACKGPDITRMKAIFIANTIDHADIAKFPTWAAY